MQVIQSISNQIKLLVANYLNIKQENLFNASWYKEYRNIFAFSKRRLTRTITRVT